MEIQTFYTTVGPISFTLLGLTRVMELIAIMVEPWRADPDAHRPEEPPS